MFAKLLEKCVCKLTKYKDVIVFIIIIISVIIIIIIIIISVYTSHIDETKTFPNAKTALLKFCDGKYKPTSKWSCTKSIDIH
jgi:predicted PurR-regulated permease PerM